MKNIKWENFSGRIRMGARNGDSIEVKRLIIPTPPYGRESNIAWIPTSLPQKVPLLVQFSTWFTTYKEKKRIEAY